MIVRDNNFKLMEEQTQVGFSRTYSTYAADTVTLDVSGDAINYLIEVQGKVSPESEYRSMYFTVRIDNGDLGEIIRGNGNYMIDVTSVCSIRLNVIQIASGSISVALRATSM